MVAAAPFIRWRQEKLTPSDLAGQDFVAFDDDLRVGREVKRYLRETGIQVNVVMHFDNTQTMKEAVVLGAGFSILPVRVLRNDIEHGRLVAIPIEGCTLVRPLGIIHRRRKTSTGPRRPSWNCCGRKPPWKCPRRLERSGTDSGTEPPGAAGSRAARCSGRWASFTTAGERSGVRPRGSSRNCRGRNPPWIPPRRPACPVQDPNRAPHRAVCALRQ